MVEINNKINRIVKDVMEIDISVIDSNTKFNEISNWDSFNTLMLISRLQEDFNIEFTALEIEETKRISDLYTLINNKIN